MKCLTVAGPPSSGKTSVLLKVAGILAGRGLPLGVVKFDCLASRDRESFARAGIPAAVGLSGALCPDHFYVCNAADAHAWGRRQQVAVLAIESAGLCNRCAPHLEGVLAVCVVDNLSGIDTPAKIGPMLRLADVVAITKGDVVSQAEREVFAFRVRQANPRATVLFVSGLTGQGADALAHCIAGAPETPPLDGATLRFTMPQSSFFAGSVVFDEDVSGLIITAPLVTDHLNMVLGYVRTIGSDRTYAPTTTPVYANEEAFLLALPITVEGFKATPWAAYGQGGKGGHYFTEGGWAEGLISSGILTVSPYGWRNNFITAMWAGTTFEVTALDPFKFYADIIWGRHGMNEYKKNIRDGWFIDAAAEYTGFEIVTPQVFGFWSTGEDKSTTNGSERMPLFFPGSGRGAEHNGGTQSWNAGNSFLFDGGQELVKGSNMGISPVGNWGLGASLNNATFIEKLTHRLTVAYVHGNNSAKAIRYANYVLGSNPIFGMKTPPWCFRPSCPKAKWPKSGLSIFLSRARAISSRSLPTALAPRMSSSTANGAISPPISSRTSWIPSCRSWPTITARWSTSVSRMWTRSKGTSNFTRRSFPASGTSTPNPCRITSRGSMIA